MVPRCAECGTNLPLDKRAFLLHGKLICPSCAGKLSIERQEEEIEKQQEEIDKQEEQIADRLAMEGKRLGIFPYSPEPSKHRTSLITRASFWRKQMSDASRRDKEARRDVLRVLLGGALIAVVGVVVLAVFRSSPAGFFIIIFGIGVALSELRFYWRWVKWHKRGRPYREVRHQMYPYNPYPNATCWNCGQLVRIPSPIGYVKPLWKRFDGRWQAFCSNCGANVTKAVVEAKYGNPYRGKVWPKFYKQSFLDMTRPCPSCGKVNMKKEKTCSACGASTEVQAG